MLKPPLEPPFVSLPPFVLPPFVFLPPLSCGPFLPLEDGESFLSLEDGEPFLPLEDEEPFLLFEEALEPRVRSAQHQLVARLLQCMLGQRACEHFVELTLLRIHLAHRYLRKLASA